MAVGAGKTDYSVKTVNQFYLSIAPLYIMDMTNGYECNPYAFLVEMVKLALKNGNTRDIRQYKCEIITGALHECQK